MDEENREPEQKPGYTKSFILVMAVLMAAGVLIFMIISGRSQQETINGCGVNPQSAFGQTTQSVWVEHDGYAAAAVLAGFDFETPDTPLKDYPVPVYRTYTQQIMEVSWRNEAGEEGILFSKAYTCNGAEVYHANRQFRSVVIETVGGYEVQESGDGDTVGMAFWVDGDYSYTIMALDHPLAKDAIEELIRETK